VPKSVAKSFCKKAFFRLVAKTMLGAQRNGSLWKELKGELAANRQFKNIAEAVDYAEQWVLYRTTRHYEAGVFSKSYWFRHF
jgi:hypothetical protein